MDLATKISKGKVTLQQAIVGLKALRSDWNRAETVFIVTCMALEDSDLWHEARSPRDATFGAFLQRAGICKATAYEARAKALREPDLAAVEPSIGLDAILAVDSMADPTRRAALLSALEAAALDKGMPVPAQTVKGITDRLVGGKVRLSRVAAKEQELGAIERELAAARRRIVELETEVRLLRERISAAEEQAAVLSTLAKGPKGGKQDRSKSGPQPRGKA